MLRHAHNAQSEVVLINNHAHNDNHSTEDYETARELAYEVDDLVAEVRQRAINLEPEHEQELPIDEGYEPKVTQKWAEDESGTRYPEAERHARNFELARSQGVSKAGHQQRQPPCRQPPRGFESWPG
jgi:hypothetical protein